MVGLVWGFLTEYNMMSVDYPYNFSSRIGRQAKGNVCKSEIITGMKSGNTSLIKHGVKQGDVKPQQSLQVE